MKPLIAITAGEIHNQIEPWSPITHGQSQTYIEAIVHAGGTPFIVPILKDTQQLRQLYDLADGVLFAGGNDPSPALYGESPHATVTDVSLLRDTYDMQLLEWALADKKPLLGICRGMQLLNIARGGSLHQDIPSAFADAEDHHSSTKAESLEHLAHHLKIDPQSKLGVLFAGEVVTTNTHHHQAVKQLGAGLVATAWSEDGIIEALETTDDHFALGVQSHPESLEAKAAPVWRRFFASLVNEAQQRSDR